MPRKTLVILSQVFVPDPAGVGQYMANVAIEMARRGHRVKVYASARGYEDPARRYLLREVMQGVDIHRLDFASFGKRHLAARILGTASFMVQIAGMLLTERNLGAIFFSTSPPLIGFVASLIGWLRGVPVAYWAMDLNPDQLIAMGKLKSTDRTARMLEAVNRFILRRARLIVALDRFMAARLEARMPLGDRLLVMTLWPHEDHIAGNAEQVGNAPATDNPFRREQGWTGKFVVMYSGNHSPSNPLTTLLEAARRFADDDSIRFAFVGGGTGKKEVAAYQRQYALSNVVSLPYQPIENLRHSLSAADVHVVSLGDGMVGIIHPCKIYGAMAASRPILYFGPRPSHISDLLDAHPIGVAVQHGDVENAVKALQMLMKTSPHELAEMGTLAATVLKQTLTQQKLCGEFCDALEQALKLRQAPAADKVK